MTQESFRRRTNDFARTFGARRSLALASVIAVLLAIGAFAWFVSVPGYRPALQPGERFGIDVSAHQGSIDWNRVAKDDITFTYIKATEGGDFIDDHFHTNWEATGTVGLERGAYHYFTLCRPGTDQADNFLRTVSPDVNMLPAAVDLEFAGNCSGRPTR